MKKVSKKAGFTLIEILVVMGIIAILAAIVLIAINPARQFAQANNTQRVSNVNAILNAVGQFMADNQGNLPADITTTDREITNALADICPDLVPDYLPALPVDPEMDIDPITSCTTYTTDYNIVVDAAGRVTVSAPQAQLGETIEVTR